MESSLTSLPNIGKTLALKLEAAGIKNERDLLESGSENTLIKLYAIDPEGICLNMLYALEGAIRGIRWHGLEPGRKQELKAFFRMNFPDLH